MGEPESYPAEVVGLFVMCPQCGAPNEQAVLETYTPLEGLRLYLSCRECGANLDAPLDPFVVVVSKEDA